METIVKCPLSKDAFLSYFPMEQYKGTIIICPGGGYEWLSPREAKPVAQAFFKNGWQAYILYYSVGKNLHKQPLKELAWAVSYVRGISNKTPVFVCGFSAGGHLAASLGVHWNDTELFENNVQCKPDGLILCYPIIFGNKKGHIESIKALVGQENSTYFSLEKHVTKDTPPCFLWHTATDNDVPVQNAICFAQELIKNKVETEMHIYPFGMHGLSLATPAVEECEKGRYADTHIASWFQQCLQWISLRNMKKE